MKDKSSKICSLLTVCLLLTACSGDRFLEKSLTADPRLKNTPSPTITPSSQGGDQTPYTRHPTPDTPHPTPDTPHPTPTSSTSTPTPNPQPPTPYIEDLVSLGIIEQGKDFNAPITRREYLRWLFKANNKFYSNQPSLQIKPADINSQPLFKDLPNNDPDYPLIQGLAEAGIIPSTLTKDNTDLLLRPDAPLTREVMVLWKVPLDYRKPFPVASLETIKSSWGFSDANLIDAKAWRPLYIDQQNGEASNLRRALGYTVLLQPKKVVTRSQAAATIWSFGFQDNVLTAADVLKREGSPSPSVVLPSPNVLKSP